MDLLCRLSASRRLRRLATQPNIRGTWPRSFFTGRASSQSRSASQSTDPKDSRGLGGMLNEFILEMREGSELLNTLRREVTSLTKEWIERPIFRIHSPSQGQVEMLQTFEKSEDINKFKVIFDSENNEGFSTAQFELTERETAVFSGNLNTTPPKDGRTRSAGYAAFMSRQLYKSFFVSFNWTNWTHLVMKIRGDGRSYMAVLSCPRRLDSFGTDQYHYPIYTRGGPYWQIVKIPFSHFLISRQGRVEVTQEIFPKTTCSSYGIALMDSNDGPFRFEIEYFGLENQEIHKEVCPYEMYD